MRKGMNTEIIENKYVRARQVQKPKSLGPLEELHGPPQGFYKYCSDKLSYVSSENVGSLFGSHGVWSISWVYGNIHVEVHVKVGPKAQHPGLG